MTKRMILLLALLMFAFQSYAVPSQSRGEGTESTWIRNDPKNTSVVVFVHGWTGDSSSTWLNQRSGTDWPHLLKGDPELANFDIYSFQYTSCPRGVSNKRDLSMQWNPSDQ
jgi:hypothetical protein